MSTPESPGGGLPPQAQLPLGQLPRRTDTPSQAVPTPGVASSAARHPGVPTFPDPDQAFVGMLAQLANELFRPGVPAAATTPAPPVLTDGATLSAEPRDGLSPSAASSPLGEAPAQPPPVGAAPALEPRAPALFEAATAAPAPSTPVAPLASGPFVASPATVAPSSSVPVQDPKNPFTAPLSFEALAAPLALPVLDGSPDSPVDPATPYWLLPAAEAPTPTPLSTRGVFDAHAIRREFPALQQRVNGHRLVWLDNAATTQKPQVVIDRLSHFYEHDNSNIHRAAHTLAARATDAYENARETVRRFINAPSKNEVVFVRGTTEGINLIAQTFGRRQVNEGDEVVVTWLEHHANIVPWHRLCAERKATLKVAPVDETGQIILEEYERLLGPKTRLVALSQVSNALGTVTPAKEMIELAHRHGAKVLLDGAQAVSHLRVDVQQLDCDFYVFSGHKVFAPTGIGVVFGKAALLEAMPPWQGGGNMIQDVRFEKIEYQPAPAKFEAGTGNIADAIGLGTALDWLMRIGVDAVGRWEHELLEYATPRLLAVPGLTLIGTAPGKAAVMSFVLAGQKTKEIGGLLDKEGIAVRSGHHCAQPILRRFGVEATVRASLAPYNTLEDIDALCAALHRLQAGKAR
jgi:cysteine desulfurase/selenocysteine lyase